MTGSKVQGVDNPRQFPTAVPVGADLSVNRQISPVFRLTVDFVSDHQRIVAMLDGALVDPLQQVLKHYRMRRVRVGVAGTLPDYIHGSGDDLDVLRGDRFDHVIEHTDPRSDRNSRPVATRVKDLVPMEFDLCIQLIRRCRSGSNPLQLVR